MVETEGPRPLVSQPSASDQAMIEGGGVRDQKIVDEVLVLRELGVPDEGNGPLGLAGSRLLVRSALEAVRGIEAPKANGSEGGSEGG